MKKILLFTAASILSISSFAQEEKVVERKVQKQVELTENNGVKKLVIKTTDNGKVTEEVYEGEAADAKLAELESTHSEANEIDSTTEKAIQKEIKMEDENGEKVLTIKTNENGEEKLEVYKGEEADAKLKEIENSMKTEQHGEHKPVIKIVKEEKTMKKAEM